MFVESHISFPEKVTSKIMGKDRGVVLRQGGISHNHPQRSNHLLTKPKIDHYPPATKNPSQLIQKNPNTNSFQKINVVRQKLTQNNSYIILTRMLLIFSIIYMILFLNVLHPTTSHQFSSSFQSVPHAVCIRWENSCVHGFPSKTQQRDWS